MAFRTGPIFQLASNTVPQPLFGSWITQVNSTTGVFGPFSVSASLTLGTASASGNDASNIFMQNEEAWLIDPNGGNAEAIVIGSISGNTVTLQPQTRVLPNGQQNFCTANPHVAGVFGTGTFIMPKQKTNNFLVDLEDGATGPFLYLGNRYNMTATQWRFYKLANVATNVQPYNFGAGMFSQGNPIDSSELWVLGSTAGDTYNVSLMVD